MGRPPKYDWAALKAEYAKGGYDSLKEFAEEKNIPYDLLRKQFKGKAPVKKKNQTKTKAVKKLSAKIEREQEPGLTEKQRLFCLYYVKLRNATQAAINAGYAKDGAHVEGHRALQNAKVRAELRRIKGNLAGELFLDAMDVLEMYMKIAFADVGEYVEFGQRDVQAMGAFGPIYEKKEAVNVETGEKAEVKFPVMKRISYVDFKESGEVDTSLIAEVKQGREGVSIKLHDKMKALEKLEKYLDILPDQHKRMIENERLKLDREKLEIEKKKIDPGDNAAEDDGFLEALGEEAEAVWGDSDEE
jgi:phage terminase small subunit